MRNLVILLSVTLLAFTCSQTPGKFKLDNSYITGKWIHFHGKTVQNGDTTNNQIQTEVYYNFNSNGLINIKGTDNPLFWSVETTGNKLFISEKPASKKAEYNIHIIDKDKFVQSKKHNGKIFLYYFKRGWK